MTDAELDLRLEVVLAELKDADQELLNRLDEGLLRISAAIDRIEVLLRTIAKDTGSYW